MNTSNRSSSGHVAPAVGYDVIGDVHGHADALTDLLTTMDYTECDGVWSNDTRQAIFVGDLIDRGPKQVESVRIARAMVDAGAAQIVLGNHEFNAVAYATPDGNDNYLRPHGDPDDEKQVNNVKQHAEFIEAVGFGTEEHLEMIEWFKTIPLWLDLGGLRVVHACWSSDDIAYLRPLVGPNNNLTAELVVTSSTEGHPSYVAVERILKGPEVPIDPLHYHDKGGHFRDLARIRWWDESATSLSTLAMIPSGTEILEADHSPASLPDDPIAEKDRFAYDSDIPVIFGHYWWSAKQGITSDRAVCVDFSIAMKGELVAYRWDDQQTTLSEANIARAGTTSCRST